VFTLAAAALVQVPNTTKFCGLDNSIYGLGGMGNSVGLSTGISSVWALEFHKMMGSLTLITYAVFMKYTWTLG